ncbi:MAG: YlqD family protein [Leptolyngbyaceae bacterium]|nr:YlqD family protein [Leptolyngbyaceae bacterium]
MDLGSQLLLKRAINIKVVVTPRWKEEVQTQLQNQINRLDGQLQQLETQGQRAIAEVQKKAEGEDPVIAQQVGSIQNQVNQNKSKILEKKNQALQQLQQVQMLEMDQEVGQGQLESFFTVNKGDNLVKKMQVEILLKDGVIEEIRGEL